MDELTLEYFTNDKYKLLEVLYDKQIRIKNNTYIPLSQQEIADIVNFSKLKTNKLLNELIDKQLVDVFQGKKGKYILTDKALKTIKIIKKTNI